MKISSWEAFQRWINSVTNRSALHLQLIDESLRDRDFDAAATASSRLQETADAALEEIERLDVEPGMEAVLDELEEAFTSFSEAGFLAEKALNGNASPRLDRAGGFIDEGQKYAEKAQALFEARRRSS